MSDVRKLKSKLFIEGKIHILTGLHIGGNSGGLKVGGADQTVVRDTIKNEPYIPGSSLKGKMRSLLERARGPERENKEEGGYSNNNGAGTFSSSLLGKLFGVSADKNKGEPTRLIVRDAFLTDESSQRLKQASNTDMPMTEVKTEVNIDRITSNAHPREFERVPAGAEFKAELILTLFEGDEEVKFLDRIFESFALIQADSLGGHGSRGYGKVLFKEFKISEKTTDSYKKGESKKDFKYNISDEFSKDLEQKAG